MQEHIFSPDGRSAGDQRAQRGRAEDILAGLNEVQRRAATYRDGPLVVFAGAGSGKTRIITHRIAYLIETGVPPGQILAVTFTNKAALEMQSRVDQLTLLGRRCLIATFHSACARWLREFAPELGFNSDFTIYDDSDSLSAIKSILKEFKIRLDQEVTPQEYKAAIGRAKTMALLPSDERLRDEYADVMPPAGVQVYKRYQEFLASCNAMDFGDLIMNVLLLFRRNRTVRERLQRRYRYILVDEYQDTNRTQFELISHLAASHRNLFVVGDDDQSIYSWRGALPANIIDFDKTYPDAHRITLEQNYRCSGTIVNAASAMISNNQKRVAKKLFTENPDGDPIDFRLETDHETEAWWVVDRLRTEQNRFPFSDVAIFYRTNSQSRQLEDALRRENIPYRIYGTVRFYDRLEVKDLMAYIRLVVNPSDNVSLKRIINTPPRGIGKKAVETIEVEAARREISMLDAVRVLVEENLPRLGTKLKSFLKFFDSLRDRVQAASVDDVMEILLEETGYVDYVKKKYPDQSLDKIENIQELGSALADYAMVYAAGTLSDWLQSVTLASSEAESEAGVSLMTLHMAKGLEYRRVFIVGLEENLLPHRGSMEDHDSLEEERRLFYVGMTRAKEKLSLSAAYRRRTFNTYSSNRPSRFLGEVPSRFFEPVTPAESPYVEATDFSHDSGETRYDYADPDVSEGAPTVTVGSRVVHPTYGKGTVETVEVEFGSLKAIVRFDEFGLRKVTVSHLSL